MEQYSGLVEIFVVAMCVGAWAILEWQGRRLDRQRAEREKNEGAKKAD